MPSWIRTYKYTSPNLATVPESNAHHREASLGRARHGKLKVRHPPSGASPLGGWLGNMPRSICVASSQPLWFQAQLFKSKTTPAILTQTSWQARRLPTQLRAPHLSSQRWARRNGRQWWRRPCRPSSKTCTLLSARRETNTCRSANNS